MFCSTSGTHPVTDIKNQMITHIRYVYGELDVAQSLVFCIVFSRSLFFICRLVIVMSVRLQFTTSDYPFITVPCYYC